MSLKRCLNPIVAFGKLDKSTGKQKLTGFMPVRGKKFFENFKDDFFDFNNNSFDFDSFKRCISKNEKLGVDTYLLPCRKCINCQLNRSQEWSIRNVLEAREYDDNQCLFITLTYDNENANQKLKKVFSDYHGLDLFSLKKTDLQLFMKKLRKRFNKYQLRFYACGEYGGLTFRPHFHILLYGLSLDDIKVYKNSKGDSYALDFKYSTKDGDYYYSELFEKEIWQNGFVDITIFSAYTAMYTARYCTKKEIQHNGASGVCYYNDLQRTFNSMSLRPSIANDYTIENLDKIYKNDEFLYHVDDKTFVLKPFSFFDRKYDIERPDEYKFIKENRKDFSDVMKYFEEIDTNLSISEYLRNEEDKVYKKLKQRSVV